MVNEYFIAPDNIDKLISVCETFDNACQNCVDNRNNPDFECTHEFGFSFEQLKQFATSNPTFDYQKYLPKHKNIIGYFFSDAIIFNQTKAQKEYEKRIAFYQNRY